MHFNSTPKVISNQLGGSLDQDTVPHVSGLHEGLSVIRQRLAQINNLLDGTLQRIHGPRPVSAAQSGKDPSTPSICEIAANIESEIALIERQANELCSFIG